METLDNFNALLYNSFHDNKQVYEGILLYGQIMGVISSFFAAAHIVFGVYYRGEQFQVERIYYIIAISVAISLYRPITQIFIDITDAFAVGISLEVKKSIVSGENDLISILDWKNASLEMSQNDNYSGTIQNFSHNQKYDTEILSLVSKHAPRSAKTFQSVLIYSSNTWLNTDQKTIHNTIIVVLSYISRGAIMGLYIIRHTFQFVLFILGPVVLALSLLPGFKKTLIAWATQYLSVTFWLPISYIVEMVLIFVYDKLSNSESTSLMSNSQISLQIYFGLFTTICFILIPLISYRIIDKNIYSRWT